MRGFKSGEFQRHEVPSIVRRFSPTAALHNLFDVNLDDLKEKGIKLILLDVDNTLLPWRSTEISTETRDWVNEAKQKGFDICVLSNTRHPERLHAICEQLSIPYLRAKFKPSRQMYQMALEKYKATPEQAVMIGDQLLTDIWGANRTGIDAIWVKPLAKKEFIGTTLISRNVERVIGGILYKYFQDDGANAETRPGFFRHAVFQQLIKFAMVGGVATVVDVGLHGLLMFVIPYGDSSLREVVGTWALQTFTPSTPATTESIAGAAYPVLKIGPTALAIMVSYLLNRIYTFKIGGEKITAKQIAQFYTVALIGMSIQIIVGSSVNAVAQGTLGAQWLKGTMFGIIAGFIWNFNAQRLWTFRQKKKL